MMGMIIRQEEPEDREKVDKLVEEAFKDEEFTDHKEHELVRKIRKSENFIPELSIKAEYKDQPMGYILLSKIQIDLSNRKIETLALAPVAVMKEYRNQGVGAKLIEGAHYKAARLGFESILLIGHDAYYPKFGYNQASVYGIRFPFDAPSKNCMAIELNPGSLAECQGHVIYPEYFYH